MPQDGTVIVLIDFDNFFGSNINSITPEAIEFQLSEIVKICEIKFSKFSRIHFRFYGGWYKESTLTKFASAIQQILYQVVVFPKITAGVIINGEIEMATALYEKPEFIWGFTYKETEGVSRIRINHDTVDTLCNENREICPKFILYKFTDKKNKKCSVVSCTNIQKNVFKGAEQKMVDTLIACDIISTSLDRSVKGIILISDDQDHFPSLALASIKKSENLQAIILCLKNEQKIEFITNFLSPFNIDTIFLS